MAWPVLAFVDVDTATGAWQVSLGTHALLRKAHLVDPTIAVASAAAHARALNAHLTLQAVAITKANLVAHFRGAALTLRTLLALLANRLAQAEITHSARTTFTDGGTSDRHTDASLLWCWCWNKS